MLAGVGEVHPEQLRVPAGPGVPDRRREPDQVAAQRHRGVPDRGVAAEPRVVVRDVHRVVGPVLQAHHLQRRAVADHQLDVVGVGRAARVIEDDHRLGHRLHVHEQVPERDALRVIAADRDHRGPAGHRLGGHRDDGGLAERRERAGAHPVGRRERAAQPGVAPFGRLHHDAGGGVRFHGHLPLGQRGVAGQIPHPAQRREPPVLLAPGGHGEVGGVERLQLVQPGDGRRTLWRPADPGHQPTAPSICSSISRFSSSAYSIGSSRAIGSTKPRTIVAAASSSVMPRLIR